MLEITPLEITMQEITPLEIMLPETTLITLQGWLPRHCDTKGTVYLPYLNEWSTAPLVLRCFLREGV